MNKGIVLFCLIGNMLSGQFLFHEQAYNFVNEGIGSINDILPYKDGSSLVVGNYNGIAFAATLFEDGQVENFKPFTLLKGDIDFTDIIEMSTNEYLIGGICNNCNQIKESSRGFIVKLSNDLNSYSNIQFLSSAIDTNVYKPVLLMEKNGAIFATYSGSLNGFGTRSHISKHNLSDLSLIWKKQYNESFFSAPIMIDSKTSDIVITAAGFDANVVIKVDADGTLLSLKKYQQGNSASCMMENEDIVLSVTLPNTQKLFLIDKNNFIKDTFTIQTGDNFFSKVVLHNYEANRVLVTFPSLSTNELPYYRVRDNIDIFDVGSQLTHLVTFPIPENGTGNRNFTASLKFSEGRLYLVGNRQDGSNRPFYLAVSDEKIKPKVPTSFYNNKVCDDTELIIDRVQRTQPAVLPHITNDVQYASKINFKGEVENLWLDVYRPYDHYAFGSSHKRPAFIYVPGGGYSFTSENSHTILMQAAERGMIGIGVKYRVGIHPNYSGNPDSAVFYAPYFLKATYRAQQDLRDAMEFIYNHAEEYNIDKNNIFLAGSSAGGNMVLNYAHVNQGDFEQSYISDLGDLKPPIKVKGIIPIAAPFNVLNFQTMDPTSFVEASENTPMYFIHGTCDPLAFYTFGNQADPTSTRSIGAYNIVCHRQKLNLPYKLHSIIGGEHTLDIVENEVLESMFQWIKNEIMCGQPISACITSTFSTTAPCSQIDTCPSCTDVATDEYDDEKIQIYPSISTGLFYLSKPTFCKIVISDMLGKTIQVLEDNIDELDLSSLAYGSYIVSIDFRSRTYKYKIIKM